MDLRDVQENSGVESWRWVLNEPGVRKQHLTVRVSFHGYHVIDMGLLTSHLQPHRPKKFQGYKVFILPTIHIHHNWIYMVLATTLIALIVCGSSLQKRRNPR